jgi:hypothetical protein
VRSARNAAHAPREGVLPRTQRRRAVHVGHRRTSALAAPATTRAVRKRRKKGQKGKKKKKKKGEKRKKGKKKKEENKKVFFHILYGYTCPA